MLLSHCDSCRGWECARLGASLFYCPFRCTLHSYKKVPLRDCPSHLQFCCGLKVFPVSCAGAIIARIGVDGLWEWDFWKVAWFRWLGVQSGLGGFLRRVYPELAHMICPSCDTLCPITVQQEGILEAARCQHQNLGIPSNQTCEANKIFTPSIFPSLWYFLPQQR